MEPTAERIDLPAGYGAATTTMAWAAVREKLEQAPRYWLVTTRRDGRAHVVPVDGIWLDEAWWYGGAPDTLHQRNLERDQRVVVHLEDTMAGRLTAASKAKYGYGPPEAAYAAGLWSLRPDKARAWSAFPTDVTRFRFG
jgi:Pyridoxamine 5'-phosphate oxidase